MSGDGSARTAVVRLIRAEPGISRVLVANRLGISRSTVTRIVSSLLENGLAVEGDTIASEAAGRRPTALALDTRRFELIGAEVSGTAVTCALANLDGDTVHEVSATLPEVGGQLAVDALLEVIGGVLRASQTTGSTVRGVGIGAPGVIDGSAGRVVWAPSLGWRNLELRELAEQRLGIPTFVENDVRLATIGEQWIGSGLGVETMAYLYVGEGVGSGVMVGGELLRGHHNTAGEVGHLLPNRRLMGRSHCDVGAMESVATTSGLARRLRELGHASDRPSALLEHLGASDHLALVSVFSALADPEDTVAADLASELMDHITMILVGLATVVDPELIILGGDIGRADPEVLDLLRQRLALAVPGPPDLLPSKLGAKAGVVGASVHALLEVEDLYVRRVGNHVA